MRNIDSRIGPLAENIRDAIKSVEATLIHAQKAIESIEASAGEDSTLVFELNQTLEEVKALSRSIRSLAEYLEQHPESVLRGK